MRYTQNSHFIFIIQIAKREIAEAIKEVANSICKRIFSIDR